MISGQAPNTENQADCQNFDDLAAGNDRLLRPGGGRRLRLSRERSERSVTSCSAAGHTWRDYNESMGATPSREASECGHPGVNMVDNTQKATAADQYATRHNPFVYFHSIIDDTTLCDTHVVNLDLLPKDLSSAANTPNYVFITPDLCDDGHDSPCANGQPGGLAQADQFLRQWVPRITNSPAFKQQNGLLIITFDEAATQRQRLVLRRDPGPGSPGPGAPGPGGGDVGAVLLSPCIAPGTVSQHALQPLHDAPQRRGPVRPAPPRLRAAARRDFVRLRRVHASVRSGPGQRRTVKAPGDRLERDRRPAHPGELERQRRAAPASTSRYGGRAARVGAWRTLLASATRRSLRFAARPREDLPVPGPRGGVAGAAGAWSTATTIVPTGARPRGAKFHGDWRLMRMRSAWSGRAIVSSTPGATVTLRFRGGARRDHRRAVAPGRPDPRHHRRPLAHDQPPRQRARATGRCSSAPTLRTGRHRMTIRVLGGTVAIEGWRSANRGADRGQWREQDSNLRRQSHAVYSRAPLTARESRRGPESNVGMTCYPSRRWRLKRPPGSPRTPRTRAAKRIAPPPSSAGMYQRRPSPT